MRKFDCEMSSACMAAYRTDVHVRIFGDGWREKKSYFGFRPDSRRWLTLSLKPTTENFVSIIQIGMELWLLKVG